MTDFAADYSECSKEDITAMSVRHKKTKNIKNSNKRSKNKDSCKNAVIWKSRKTVSSFVERSSFANYLQQIELNYTFFYVLHFVQRIHVLHILISDFYLQHREYFPGTYGSNSLTMSGIHLTKICYILLKRLRPDLQFS